MYDVGMTAVDGAETSNGKFEFDELENDLRQFWHEAKEPMPCTNRKRKFINDDTRGLRRKDE